MPHIRYSVRPNAVGLYSIIDIFTDDPVTIGRFQCINMHADEAADMLEILNDVDLLKRCLWSMADD